MTIKSDKWIRRMAESHGMIEPFEPGQVREANGQKIVSYGTSSYGYDIRCADEFKIFTNINSTIVDPKNFDENSFVDLKSDVCIIPPNSFALARTIEYFRIPRSVLTICLGKSTYARCGIMRVRVVRRSCFSRVMKSARPHTKIEAENIRVSEASLCLRLDACPE
jgi:dCTP deaminase